MRYIFRALVVSLALGMAGMAGSGQIFVPLASAATLDKSESMQADRLAFIQRLMNAGVFTKIEQPGTLARVFVGSAFYGATIDQKQSFVSVVYAYAYDGSDPADQVRVFDGTTGKEIGRYPNASGLLELF